MNTDSRLPTLNSRLSKGCSYFPIFGAMQMEKGPGILKESKSLASTPLKRTVQVDFYLPTYVSQPAEMSLLLINDGQDMEKLGLEAMLEELYSGDVITPLLCVGIHAGKDRKMEFGTADVLDYKGRGAKAWLYRDFIFDELLPYIHHHYRVAEFKEKAFAGFSMGALSALDIVWNKPQEFSKAGIFSGSLWWRDKDQNEADYSDDKDRIMHRQIREGGFYPWLKFFFECGTADEVEDRNNNGIIDSIDDTLDLIGELVAKGYDIKNDIAYLEIEEGKHDVPTWAMAMPSFLKWGWGKGVGSIESGVRS